MYRSLRSWPNALRIWSTVAQLVNCRTDKKLITRAARLVKRADWPNAHYTIIKWCLVRALLSRHSNRGATLLLWFDSHYLWITDFSFPRPFTPSNESSRGGTYAPWNVGWRSSLAVGRRTCDRTVVGSNSGSDRRCCAATLGKLFKPHCLGEKPSAYWSWACRPWRQGRLV